MARRKLEDRHIRKLLRLGKGSLCLTLPIEILRELGWKEGQKVHVHKRGSKVSIENGRG